MQEQKKSPYVHQELVYPGEFVAILHDSGIVELVWDAHIKVVSKETLLHVRESIARLGKGKRMPVYVSTFAFMDTTEEAQHYAGTPEAQQYTLANAVQADNLAKQIMFNLFIKFYGTSTPSKAFREKQAAFNWLLSMDTKHGF